MNIYKSGRPIEVKPFNPSQYKSVPNKKGEYRILNSDRKILYIGQTNNLKRRMYEHIRSGKLNEQNGIFAYKTADGRASRSTLANHERIKIKKHNPLYNQRAGGAGRPFKCSKFKSV